MNISSLPAARPVTGLTRLRLAFLLAVLLVGGALSSVVAQNIEHTANSANQSLKSSARVDPSTLGMSIEIPIAGYPGRGGAQLPVAVKYSSKQWRIRHLQSWQGYLFNHTQTLPEFAEQSAAGWTSSLDPPRIEVTGGEQLFSGDSENYGRPTDGEYNPENNFYIKRINVHLPDGSSHELRKSDIHYQVLTSGEINFDETGKYYATDGSRFVFDFDTRTLYLPDGSRYFFNIDLKATGYIDRNGNTLSYDGTSRQWTDALGRTIPSVLPAFGPGVPPLQTGAFDYQVAGVGGTSLTYRFVWRLLKGATAQESALADFNQALHYAGDKLCGPPVQWISPALFVSSPTGTVCGGQLFNPVLLAEVQLPNGTKYEFKYNIYGEIERINYPSGGYERFTYTVLPSLSHSLYPEPYNRANHGVSERRVNTGGQSAVDQVWNYNASVGQYGAPPYTVTTTAPDGTRTERILHKSRSDLQVRFGFDTALSGMAYDERSYSASNVMLRRKLTEWQVTGSGSYGAERDPRVTKEIDIILDTVGDALTTTTTYSHDADLNVIETKKYAFATVSQSTAQTGTISQMPLGALLRTDKATYVVNDTGIAQTTRDLYRARNMVGLPSMTQTLNPANEQVARSEMWYDEYPLAACSGVIGWTDPSTTIRGNATTSRAWLDTTNGFLETHAKYDQVGNVVQTWDAKTALSSLPTSTVSYADNFSDGINRNTYAFPTSTASAIPDPTGAGGSSAALTASTKYDFASGAVTQTTDANNQTTILNYDTLSRLASVVRPDAGHTDYTYNDTVGDLYVKTSTYRNANDAVETRQYVDGMGRGVRSALNEGVTTVCGTGTTWMLTDTEYDDMGRVKRVSNPYRACSPIGGVNPSGRWTTSNYDALGRVTSVVTPDNAQVTSAYSGTQVTVTDQAGKQRRSVTDALGRLTNVTEAANVGTCQTDGAGCATNYTYDVVGNLRRVEQGSQNRYFAYDSLGRLLRAKQPEQTGTATSNVPAVTDAITGNTSWSLAYFYDANGNLTSRVDARNVTTSYTYDALNRVRVTTYSDGTPQTSRRYDLATNAKGRLISTYETGTSGSVQYIESYDAVGRPTSISKQFYNNAGGGWSGAYRTQRGYDKAGNVTSQTYPSGRTVAYSQDAAGRSQSFTGYLGDGVLRNYATDIKYDEGSRLQQEQFGTQTNLYHKHKYNVRGQLYDIRLSTQGGNDDWNRGAYINYYGGAAWGQSSTTNNGNVTATQQHIPDASGNTQVARQQNYAYDELNRLSGMEEYLIAGGAGLQAAQWYYYDRWGNRQINDVATTANVNRTQFWRDPATNRLYSQADVNQPDFTQRQIRYDLAGNQTYDQYTSSNAYRVYDAENRMVYSNVGTGAVQSTYTYDTDGKRVRTLINNSETWFIYGMDGELVAEYAQGQTPVLPSKEYGYRNGELLIVAEAPTSYELVARHSGRCADVVNMWTHNGAPLVQYDCWGGSNQHFRIEAVGGGYYRLVAEHSNKGLEIENWSQQGGAHVIQWDYVGGANQQWSIEATDSGYVRLIARHSGQVMEIAGGPGATQNGAELIQWGWWGGSSQQWQLRGVGNSNTVKWLVNDHLGTPRMIADGTGSLAGITRRDYLPFGEELTTQGGRTQSQGYRSDNTRQGFAGYEKDSETELNFAQARYQSPTQGRFTSPDPLYASANPIRPQSWNRYLYVENSPVNFTDPSGLSTCFNAECSGLEDEDSSTPESVQRGLFRYESIMKDGYDPELERFSGDVTVQLRSENGSLIAESATLTNPTLDNVFSEARVFTDAIRRNQALAGIKKRGWDNYSIALTRDKEGFTFVAGDDEATDFLREELKDANFDKSTWKLFYGEHEEQVGGCSNGKCADYRSKDGYVTYGRMQVVYNSGTGRGYVDRDRYAPHGQGIRGFLGHVFLEGLSNQGGRMQNIRGVSYVGFPTRRR